MKTRPRVKTVLGGLALTGLLLFVLVYGINFLIPPAAAPGEPLPSPPQAVLTSSTGAPASETAPTPTEPEPYPPDRESEPVPSVSPSPYPPPKPGPVIAPTPTIDLSPPRTPVSSGPPTIEWKPTFPPLPTPTLSFEPLAQSYPPQKLPDNPAGTVYYGVLSGEDLFSAHPYSLPVGEHVEALAAPVPLSLPSAIENRVVLEIQPATGGRYWVLVTFMEPLTYPIVLDTATGEIKEPLAANEFGPGFFYGWHPDGIHFLFFVDGGGPWIVNAETEAIFPLDVRSLLQGAAISPDGTRVAYIVDQHSGDELWIVDSSGPHFIVEVGFFSQIYPGSWSPDGTRLVFFGSCGDLETSSSSPLCLLDLESGERRHMNIPSFAGLSINWSPDGRYVAALGYDPEIPTCKTGDEGYTEEICPYAGHVIYLQDMQTGEVRKLANGLQFAWSPDGSRLAFLSAQSGAPEVWTIRVDGSELQQLTNDGLTKSPGYLFWSKE